MRKPGAQPPGCRWTSAASPCGLQGLLSKFCLPWSLNLWWQYEYHHCFPFIVNFNRIVSMLIGSVRGAQWTLITLGKPFLRSFWSGSRFSHGDLGLGTSSPQSSWGGSVWQFFSEVVPITLPCLCSGLNHLLSSYTRLISPFLTSYFATGILVSSYRISLFHSNNQQFEAVM